MQHKWKHKVKDFKVENKKKIVEQRRGHIRSSKISTVLVLKIMESILIVPGLTIEFMQEKKKDSELHQIQKMA
jgi:hypothetical protein